MQSKCKAMQSNFIRLVFVLILSNYLIINKAVVSFRYAVFTMGQLPYNWRKIVEMHEREMLSLIKYKTKR